MRFLYTLSISFYYYSIRIASLFNDKAKKWVSGRKNIFYNLENKLNQSPPLNSKLFWFHCASLGEFEQGRPLIEKMKERDSSVKILLTFFSPSGYEVKKNYAGADYIFYLPIDTSKNAEKFISIVKPHAAFFIKYEFWFNYLHHLKKNNVPTYLISGIFREKQHFFKSYGKWFKEQLKCFNHFFVQDNNSRSLLKSIGYENVTVSGDTRFDRVYEIAQNVKPIDMVVSFVGEHNVFIAGSTWEEDVKIISDFKFENYKLIIAPHEIDEKNIQTIIQQFNNSTVIRYSQADQQTIKKAQVLIIDNIGMLSSLYQYGSIAFIGGGFGKGIHNILEAATFGLPVIFGPKYEKFAEAKELIKLGGAFSMNDKNEFEKVIKQLNNQSVLHTASAISKNYIVSNIGATNKIINTINSK